MACFSEAASTSAIQLSAEPVVMTWERPLTPSFEFPTPSVAVSDSDLPPDDPPEWAIFLIILYVCLPTVFS
jgi:hypothetical protein